MNMMETMLLICANLDSVAFEEKDFREFHFDETTRNNMEAVKEMEMKAKSKKWRRIR